MFMVEYYKWLLQRYWCFSDSNNFLLDDLHGNFILFNNIKNDRIERNYKSR